MKKYELTNEEIRHLSGKTLYRIRALTSFDNVLAGDKGGYIEKESNLSHKGTAWVGGNAIVFGDAHIYGNAQIYDEALIYNDVRVRENAQVFGRAIVCGSAIVKGSAKIYGSASVFNFATIGDNALVHANASVFGSAHILGDAEVFGNAQVFGSAKLFNGAEVFKQTRFLCLVLFDDTTTFFRTKDSKIHVAYAYSPSDMEKFVLKVKDFCPTNHQKAYMQAIELAKAYIETEKPFKA